MNNSRPPQVTLSGIERAPKTEVLLAEADLQRFVAKDRTFAVLNARRQPNGQPIVLIGDIANVRLGEPVHFTGRIEKHPTHGERFRVESFVPVLPSSQGGMARFLASGLVRGVGAELAQRVVDKFGARTLDVITKESGRLKEVKGMGGKRGKALAEAVKARRGEADSLSFLQGLGLGPALARKLYARFGAGTAAQLQEDPYLATETIAGIGFLTADRIGKELGFSESDPRRARGATLHVLAKGAEDGHTYLPLSRLAEGLTNLGVRAELAKPSVDALVAADLVVLEGEDVFLRELHGAESDLSEGLAELTKDRKFPSDAKPHLLEHTASLAPKQAEAVEVSLTSGLLVLTGGPGTGKTTTIRALAAVHAALGRRVVLAAPTGRAAKRMSEATGREAKTLHRLLEWNPGSADFARDADNPIEGEVIIIDEASMLDVRLGAALVRAVPISATLVFVGDIDQLPPVGAGHVLRELLRSETVRVVRLDRVFRQAEESAIVRGAHAIAKGLAPETSPRGEKGSGDLFFIEAGEPERALDKLRDVLRRIPTAYGLDPLRDVQVLTPMRKGPLGTEVLNAFLQSELVPTAGRGRFRTGDKVMQTANDYEREVWNGDIGWVDRIVDGVTYVSFDGRAVSYRDDELEGLTLAYAATVHKSQGSEFPAVVLILHRSQFVMLTRPLLYTAITRAKRLAVIVGDHSAITRAARNATSSLVLGRLGDRLRTLDEAKRKKS